MVMSDIGREAAETSSSNDSTSTGSGGSSYDRLDVSDKEFVKMHPGPTALMGSATALRFFPPAPDSEQDGTATFILENPEVPEDEDFESVAIFESTSDTGDDYKVVNTEDSNIDVYDIGVSVGDMFESEEVEDFEDGEYCIKLSTNAGRSVMRTLDVKGLPNLDVVRNDDYDPEIQDNGYPTTNDALIEKHPDNDADTYTPPRYSRDPQLRPDVEGRDIVVMIQRLSQIDEDYNGDAFWSTVLADLEDDRQAELAETYSNDDFYDGGDSPEDYIHEIDGREFIRLAPTSEFEPDEELLVETQWVEWHWPGEEEIERLREEQGVTAE